MTVGSDEVRRVVFVLDTDRSMFEKNETESSSRTKNTVISCCFLSSPKESSCLDGLDSSNGSIRTCSSDTISSVSIGIISIRDVCSVKSKKSSVGIFHERINSKECISVVN